MANKRRLQNLITLKYGDRLLYETSANINTQVINDAVEESPGRVDIKVATGTNDKEIDFTLYGLTDGRVLYIESDQDISVKLNSASNTPINITKPSAEPSGQVLDTNVKMVGVLCLHTSSLTKVYLTNSSGNEASVKVFAAGI